MGIGEQRRITFHQNKKSVKTVRINFENHIKITLRMARHFALRQISRNLQMQVAGNFTWKKIRVEEEY